MHSNWPQPVVVGALKFEPLQEKTQVTVVCTHDKSCVNWNVNIFILYIKMNIFCLHIRAVLSEMHL